MTRMYVIVSKGVLRDSVVSRRGVCNEVYIYICTVSECVGQYVRDSMREREDGGAC